MSEDKDADAYQAARPAVEALSEDLWEYFNGHKVRPEHAVLAMIKLTAAITVDGCKSTSQAIEGGRHLIAALSENLAEMIAKAISIGRLK